MKITFTLARSSRLETLIWTVNLLLAAMISSVTSAPTEDLISKLPGQPHVGFKLYGGYVIVDEANGRALYYYFVEAETAPSSKPLTLWLTGGPGCSSLGGGGFSELGPFYPSVDGTSLIKNNDSWNKEANIIFLESPAGVGFSYSNTSTDYKTDDEKTAKDSLTFLLNWFKKFPEYQKNDFYIAGESYGGHYAPQLATVVLANNKISGQVEIRLKGVMIGNPLIEYEIDLVYSPIVFLWSHGLISQHTYDTIMNNCKFNSSEDQNNLNCTNALDEAILESDYDSGHIDPYNILGDVCYGSSLQEARKLKIMMLRSKNLVKAETTDPCIDDSVYKYLNLPEVQSALHAKETFWSVCTDSIDYKTEDLVIPMLPVLRVLLQSGIRLWIYSGDQDAIIPFIGTRELSDRLGSEVNKTLGTPEYRSWFQGKQVGGWTQSWGNLTFATVKGAGHLVPRDQGPRALQLFASFISGRPLPWTRR